MNIFFKIKKLFAPRSFKYKWLHRESPIDLADRLVEEAYELKAKNGWTEEQVDKYIEDGLHEASECNSQLLISAYHEAGVNIT